MNLRGLSWDHPRGHDCAVAATELYRESHPGVTVEWEPRSLQAFGDDHLDELAASYDLLIIDHPHVPFAVDRALLAPLDGTGHDAELAELAVTSVGPSHRSYAVVGHQYALAVDAAAQVSVSRPDLIAEPPRTWDEVFELARQGRVLWPGKPIDAYSSILSVAASYGHPAFAAPGVFLPEEPAIAALELLRRLADLVPAWCLGADPIAIAEALVGSDDHWFSPLLFGYTNYSRPGFRRVRLRYTDVTAGPEGIRGSLLGGAGIAVSAFSAHQDAALDLAYWLASAPVQDGAYFWGGGQPGNVAAWDDPRADEEVLGFFSGTRRTLETAYVRPQHPRYVEVQEQLSPLANDVVAGRLSPERFVALANEATERAMGTD